MLITDFAAIKVITALQELSIVGIFEVYGSLPISVRMMSSLYIVVVCFALATVTVGAPNKNIPNPIDLSADLKIFELGSFSNYIAEDAPEKISEAKADETDDNCIGEVKYKGDKDIIHVKIESTQKFTKESAVITEAIGKNIKKIQLKAAKPEVGDCFTYTAKFYYSTIKTKNTDIGKESSKGVLLAVATGFEEFSENEEAKIIVKYPSSLPKYADKEVTYVHVTSKQTSNEKLVAEVSKGELPKPTDGLEVILKTKGTKLLSYEVTFYGAEDSKTIDPKEPPKTTYQFGTSSPYLKPLDTKTINCKPQGETKKCTTDAEYSNTDTDIAYVTIESEQEINGGSAVVTEGAIGTKSIKIQLQIETEVEVTFVAKFYSSGLKVKTSSVGKASPKTVILARVQGDQQYTKDSTATAVVKYPGSSKHEGKKVTYVSATSKQTSEDELKIAEKDDLKTITLETKNTKLFAYEVVFYGTEDSKAIDPPKTTYQFGTSSPYLKPLDTKTINCKPQGETKKCTTDAEYSNTDTDIAYVTIESEQEINGGSAVVTEGAIGTKSIKIQLQIETEVEVTFVAKFYSSGLKVKTSSVGKASPKTVILARVQGDQQYTKDSTATAVVKYPGSSKHEGKKVTYVSATSKQTSEDELKIAEKDDLKTITLETKNTKLFAYEVVFYGTEDSKAIDPPKTTYQFGTSSPYLKPLDTKTINCKPQGETKKCTTDAEYSNTDTDIAYVTIESEQEINGGSAVVTEGAIGTKSIKIQLQIETEVEVTFVAKFYSSGLKVETGSVGKSSPKDVILARVQGDQQYTKGSTATAVVKYPGSSKHKGKKVTYAFVTSKQTSEKLDVSVTKGEIAKATDDLEITLKADNTKLLSYEVVFYNSAARYQPFIFTTAVALMVFLWNRVAKL